MILEKGRGVLLGYLIHILRYEWKRFFRNGYHL